MVWGGERKQKVWVNQSDPVTSAGGTFLACRAWIKLAWARAQVPFSHTEGESEICQQYLRKSGEEKWEQLETWRSCLQDWGRKHRGAADVASPLLSLGCSIPFLADSLCSRTPKNDFNKTQWVPKSQTNFSPVLMWYQQGGACKTELRQREQHHGQIHLCLFTNYLEESCNF